MKSPLLPIIGLFLCLTTATLQAQYSADGFKNGLTVGTQSWNGQDREPMFGYHADYVYERFQTEDFSLIAQIGYHQRGSAIRTQFRDLAGNLYRTTRRNVFHNAALMLGVKNTLPNAFLSGQPYYLLGARVEYTFADSIATAQNLSQYVRPVNYGVTVGGGVQFKVGDRYRFFVELQVAPDFSQQLYAPPGNYFANFNGNTVFLNLPEQRVNNLSMELSVGWMFLHY